MSTNDISKGPLNTNKRSRESTLASSKPPTATSRGSPTTGGVGPVVSEGPILGVAYRVPRDAFYVGNLGLSWGNLPNSQLEVSKLLKILENLWSGYVKIRAKVVGKDQSSEPMEEACDKVFGFFADLWMGIPSPRIAPNFVSMIVAPVAETAVGTPMFKTLLLDACHWQMERFFLAINDLIATTTIGGVGTQLKADGFYKFKAALENLESRRVVSKSDITAFCSVANLEAVGYASNIQRCQAIQRTRRQFRLPVFTLEAENLYGYHRVRVIISSFVESCTVIERNSFIKSLSIVVAETKLCWTRVLGLLLHAAELTLTSSVNQLLPVVLQIFSVAKIREQISFVLNGWNIDGAVDGIEPSPEGPTKTFATSPPPPPDGFFRVVAILINDGVLSLADVWPFLAPSDSILSQLAASLFEAHQNEIRATTPASPVPSSSSSGASCPASPKGADDVTPSTKYWLSPLKGLQVDGLLQYLSALPSTKLSLIAALIEINAWPLACQALDKLENLGLIPSLFGEIRDSICGLLMWVVRPLMTTDRGADLTIVGGCVPNLSMRHIQEIHSHSPDQMDWSQLPLLARGLIHGSSGFAAEIKTEMGLVQAENFEVFWLDVVPVVTSRISWMLAYCPETFEIFLRIVGTYLATRNKDAIALRRTVNLLADHWLPALTLAEPSPSLAEGCWEIIKLIPSSQRFGLYSKVFHERIRHFPFELAGRRIRLSVSRQLKRVTAAERSSDVGPSNSSVATGRRGTTLTVRETEIANALAKMAVVNPFETMDAVLSTGEMFDRMLVRVLLDYLTSLHPLPADITGFLMVERVHVRELLEGGKWSLSRPMPKRLRNTAHFAARFHRRFPSVDLRPLLLAVRSRIQEELKNPSFPNQLAGLFGDYIFLEEVVTWLGGIPRIDTDEMSLRQRHSRAGGPVLRSLLLAEGERREEEARPGSRAAKFALRDVLCEGDLALGLLFSLTKLRLEIEWDSDPKGDAGSDPLRVLSRVVDSITGCLMQLLEFLSTSLQAKEYSLLLPTDLSTIFRHCDPATAWAIIRPALPRYEYHSTTEISRPSHLYLERFTAGTLPPSPTSPQTTSVPDVVASPSECSSTPEIELVRMEDSPTAEDTWRRIIRKSAKDLIPPESFNHISLELYLTFWRLDLCDIWVPDEVYKSQAATLSAERATVDDDRRAILRSSSASGAEARREVRELERRSRRLTEMLKSLQDEYSNQLAHRGRVMEVIKAEAPSWFLDSNGPSVFLSVLIVPRICVSLTDALFCARFILVMTELEVPKFNIWQFFDLWTVKLVSGVSCCTQQEADLLGVFVSEVFSKVRPWLDDYETTALAFRNNTLYWYSSTSVPKEEDEDDDVAIVGASGPMPEGLPMCPNFNGSLRGDMSDSPEPMAVEETSDLGPVDDRPTVTEEGAIECDCDVSMVGTDDLGPSNVVSKEELQNLVVSWEGKIFLSLQRGLGLVEASQRQASSLHWMEQRTVLKFLNACHEAFPVTNLLGHVILMAIPNLITDAKSRGWDDVVVNAKALERNLLKRRPRWISHPNAPPLVVTLPSGQTAAGGSGGPATSSFQRQKTDGQLSRDESKWVEGATSSSVKAKNVFEVTKIDLLDGSRATKRAKPETGGLEIGSPESKKDATVPISTNGRPVCQIPQSTVPAISVPSPSPPSPVAPTTTTVPKITTTTSPATVSQSKDSIPPQPVSRPYPSVAESAARQAALERLRLGDQPPKSGVPSETKLPTKEVPKPKSRSPSLAKRPPTSSRPTEAPGGVTAAHRGIPPADRRRPDDSRSTASHRDSSRAAHERRRIQGVRYEDEHSRRKAAHSRGRTPPSSYGLSRRSPQRSYDQSRDKGVVGSSSSRQFPRITHSRTDRRG